MREIDFLQQYIDAAKDSTNRTRQILLVIVVASILVFAAFWNSRTGGWANSRLAIAKATEDILRNEAERRENPSIAELTVPVGEEDLYQKAKKYAHTAPSRTWHQAKESVFWSQKIRTEQVGQIQVPVLGINFDVNDLGMLGGFSFIVLLMWVNYSLWHHSNNLRLAFEFAKELDANEPEGRGKNRILFHTYQNLVMRQVLTIPPRPASTRPAKTDKLTSWVRKVSKLMYALPLAVQTTVVVHDWETSEIGRLINPEATNTVLNTGTAFWVGIVVLTVMCFSMWSKTYNTWKSAAETI
jgi:hypothetical protein